MMIDEPAERFDRGMERLTDAELMVKAMRAAGLLDPEIEHLSHRISPSELLEALAKMSSLNKPELDFEPKVVGDKVVAQPVKKDHFGVTPSDVLEQYQQMASMEARLMIKLDHVVEELYGRMRQVEDRTQAKLDRIIELLEAIKNKPMVNIPPDHRLVQYGDRMIVEPIREKD